MREKYFVYCAEREAGAIHVEKMGLYLRLYGKLRLEKGKIWRIIAHCENKQTDLGICLFEDPYYTLDKKIPQKRFNDADWKFEAVCPSDFVKKSVPVLEDRPFERLDEIEGAVYLAEGEQSEIIIDADH